MQDNEATRGVATSPPPRATVIIPVRNAAETLAETLQSLADQAVGDFEILIIDDGSTDGTAAVVEAWMARDTRIRMLSQPPSGVSVARNAGLDHARGDWILFLDGDDWITPDFFARMLGAADEQPDAEIIYCGYRRVPPDGTQLPIGFERGLEANAFKILAVNCEVCIHSLLIRRTLLIEAGGFDTSLKTSEDWDLWIRFARMGARFLAVDKPMALYRVRPGSASSKAAQMTQDYQTVVRRAHGPDPRVTRGPERFAQGWRGTDLDQLCMEKAAYLAASEAAGGSSGVAAFDRLQARADCATFIPLLSKAIFDGLTIGAGLPASAIDDRMAPYVQEIADRIGQMAQGAPAAGRWAETVLREAVGHVFDAQDLTTPKTLWGFHGRTLDLAAPVLDFTIPDDVRHLVLRLQYKHHPIETYHLQLDGPVTGAALEEKLLSSIGFTVPESKSRLVKAAAFGPRVLGMTLRIATKIWASKRERKRKFTALLRNLSRIAAICARHSFARRGEAVRRLSGNEALDLVAQCRAELLPADHQSTDDMAGPVPARLWSGAPRQLPVLMYHRIAEDGPAALAEWRLGAAAFEAQLKLLKERGFTTVTSRDLAAAMRGVRRLPDRAVMLTFDDAYCDFHTRAFPLLQRYGATAELFVVTGKVGGAADWDAAYGTPAALMSWDAIRAVSDAGLVIGSHMESHRHATRLDDTQLIREGAASRFTLEAKLGLPVTSLALPFGDYDDRVIEAMALCGYRQIYTCDPARAAPDGEALRIPRLNIAGDTDLLSFTRMLGLAPVKETAFA